MVMAQYSKRIVIMSVQTTANVPCGSMMYLLTMSKQYHQPVDMLGAGVRVLGGLLLQQRVVNRRKLVLEMPQAQLPVPATWRL